MLFLEPNETPYDLRWRMMGIDVRVHPMFWLVSAIMGWRADIQLVFIWVACVFVSILIHELGHVWMGQIFGVHGHIVLYSFGGLAIGSNSLYKRWQRMMVAFAGPLAGFLFLGLLFALLWLRDPELFPAYLELARMDLGLPLGQRQDVIALWRQIWLGNRLEFSVIQDLIFINLLWGLVNLLPVWPLDGGQISRDFCQGIWPDAGTTRSLGISLVVAGLLAIHSVAAMNGKPLLPVKFGSGYTAIFFGILAVQSFQLLQQAQAEQRWQDEHWHERNDHY